MRRMKNQKGFTLMELMVVIVIVAILAAVAVPLYINYVKDARRTEAKAAIGALATAMEEYYLNKSSYATSVDQLYTVDSEGRKPSNLAKSTVDEINVNWSIEFNGVSDTPPKYSIKLSGKDAKPTKGLGVQYDYERGVGGKIVDADPTTQ